MLLIFISFLLFMPPPLKCPSLLFVCSKYLPHFHILSSKMAVINQGIFSSLTASVEATGWWQQSCSESLQPSRARLTTAAEGERSLPFAVVTDTSAWPSQNAPAFFSCSNHMMSTCLTSPAEKFLPMQKVYLVQVTFSPSISFSTATRIKPNCVSDLSRTLTASYPPPKAKWWQDRKVKQAGNIWA